MIALLFGVSVGVVTIQGGTITSQMGWAHLTIVLQVAVVTAVALFMASFSSPLLSGMITMAVFVAGNLVSQLEQVEQLLARQDNPLRHGIGALELILPNLEALNLSTEVAHSITIGQSYLVAAGWYAASYCAVVLVMAMIVFSQRDFV